MQPTPKHTPSEKERYRIAISIAKTALAEARPYLYPSGRAILDMRLKQIEETLGGV